MRVGVFEAIGLTGIGLIVITIFALYVPGVLGDSELWVLVSIYLGAPLILIGIVGAWIRALMRRSRAS